MEVERNLQDAMRVAKNLMISPKVVPGGGATEMAIARGLEDYSANVAGVHRMPFLAVAKALEVIPRTLLENCGADVVRQITALRAKHASKGDNQKLGVNGITGKLARMDEIGVWDSFEVKIQTIKTAIESSCMLLRIDDIVSGLTRSQE